MPARIEPISETALLVHLGEGIDAAVNAQVHAAAAALRAQADPNILDIVPAYASILICHALLAAPARARLHALLTQRAESARPETIAARTREHDIPVCYEGEFAPDLPALAQARGLAVDTVIARHSGAQYQVAMTGFAPGFAYLIGLDPSLASPRRRSPRIRVPAGSVGIAGTQTGIYPGDLPGGWPLIGRTPLPLFRRENAERPCLLVPGDRVRMHPITPDQFHALQAAAC